MRIGFMSLWVGERKRKFVRPRFARLDRPQTTMTCPTTAGLASLRTSEREPYSQLDDSWEVGLRRNLPKCRRAPLRGGSVELRRVCQVENLRAELALEFLELIALEHREIGGRHTWAPQSDGP